MLTFVSSIEPYRVRRRALIGVQIFLIAEIEFVRGRKVDLRFSEVTVPVT